MTRITKVTVVMITMITNIKIAVTITGGKKATTTLIVATTQPLK